MKLPLFLPYLSVRNTHRHTEKLSSPWPHLWFLQGYLVWYSVIFFFLLCLSAGQKSQMSHVHQFTPHLHRGSIKSGGRGNHKSTLPELTFVLNISQCVRVWSFTLKEVFNFKKSSYSHTVNIEGMSFHTNVARTLLEGVYMRLMWS